MPKRFATPEDEARWLISDATGQDYSHLSSGDVVAIANLLADRTWLRQIREVAAAFTLEDADMMESMFVRCFDSIDHEDDCRARCGAVANRIRMLVLKANQPARGAT